MISIREVIYKFYKRRQAERADAWDEGWVAGMADAAYLGRGEDVPLTSNPHRRD